MQSNYLIRFFISFTVLLIITPFSVFSQGCVNTTEQYQILAGTTGVDVAYDILPTKDTGSIVVGYTANVSAGGQSCATLLKLSKNGNEVWSRQFPDLNSTSLFYRAIETSDKSIVAVGFVTRGNDANTLIIKLSPDGNLLWKKELVMNNAGQQWGLMITETNDGNYFITINKNNQNTSLVQSELVKMKANDGSIIWEREFQFDKTSEPRSVLADGNNVVIVGVATGISQTLNDGFIMKLNHTTGNVVWTKMMDSEGRMNRLIDIKKQGPNYLLVMQNATVSDNNTTPALVTLDTDGNLISARGFSYSPKSNDNYPGRWVVVCKNGDVVQAYGENISSSSRPIIARFTASGNLIWAYEYRAMTQLYLNRVTEDEGGNIIAVGTGNANSGNSNDFFVIKTNASGIIENQNAGNCIPISFVPTVSNLAVNFYVATWQSILPSLAQSIDANIQIVQPTFQPFNKECNLQSTCDSLSIQGPASFCSNQNVLEITASRNAGCQTAVTWQYDISKADLIGQTDTSIFIKPKVLGNYTLPITAMLNGCTILQQTKNIAIITPPPLQLHLGNDTILCAQSHQLTATGGMAEYLWNTGATTPNIVATQSGKYWVRITDACNQQQSDTIDLTFRNIVPFLIGNDTTICGTVNLLIQGPTGMANYLWNTGSSSQNLSVTQPGLYMLTATDVCGNVLVDSLRVSGSLSSSDLSLGQDIGECIFTAAPLSTPVGMKTYLWSTGATTQNITANTPGIYSVRVTDNCNLVKADTISISILPKPIIQLGSDTSLCGNEPLVLNAGNAGSSFLWNDGNTSATNTVTNSGTYWVIVTNAYGCESKDSIVVNYSTSGDQRGFQMPSAFTPNRDGLNDCFGLKKWGNVKVIRFEVYNRWGELIFKGKSVSDCWDGTWKGQKQANSPFPYIVVVESACGIIERKGLVSIIQ